MMNGPQKSFCPTHFAFWSQSVEASQMQPRQLNVMSLLVGEHCHESWPGKRLRRSEVGRLEKTDTKRTITDLKREDNSFVGPTTSNLARTSKKLCNILKLICLTVNKANGG